VISPVNAISIACPHSRRNLDNLSNTKVEAEWPNRAVCTAFVVYHYWKICL